MSIQFNHKPFGSTIGSGSIVFRHFGTEIIYWPTPTITLSEAIVSTPVVEGVTKYKVYIDGDYYGYVDSDNIFHLNYTYDYQQIGSTVTINDAPYEQNGSEVTIL